MRSILNMLLLGSCLLCLPSFAGVPDEYCLQVEGKVLNAGLNGAPGCMARLVCNGQVVDSFLLSTPRKKFRFYLQRDMQYSVTLSQPGYLDKVIAINTKLPGEFQEEYAFSFETSLIDERDRPCMNKEVLFLPVARVFYMRDRNCFHYDKEYSEGIRRDLVAKRDESGACPYSGETSR